MNEQLSNKISGVVIETLEQLAYIFSSRADAPTDMTDTEFSAVEVSFAGPFSGQLTMDMAKSVVRELTANMLGIEDQDVTVEQQKDALKETINILCGNILPAIWGNQDIFNIGSPRVMAEQAPGEGDREKPIAVASLEIDDEMCAISLFVEGEVSENAFILE